MPYQFSNFHYKDKMIWLPSRWVMQERRNSIANALELCLSCTNPSILSLSWVFRWYLYIEIPPPPPPYSTGMIQGLCSLSDKMSYRKFSLSIEAVRLGVHVITSFWNLTGANGQISKWSYSYLYLPALRFVSKMSSHLANRGPAC